MLQPNAKLALGFLALAAACSTRPEGSSEEASAVVPGIDLVAERIDAPPAIGGSAQVPVRVCNRGDTWAPSSQLELYASADAIISRSPPPVGDFLIGNAFVDSLASDACRTVQVNVWSAPLQGEGRLGAIVDAMNTAVESNEANNTLVSGPIGFGNGPDLTVRALTVPPSASGAFAVTARVCNQGTLSAPSTTLELYGSTNATLELTPPPAGDILIGTASVPWLDVGVCVNLTANASSPPLVGEARVLSRLDPTNSIVELLESNNITASGVIGFGNGPDLIVSSVTMPQVVASSFSATVRVCNQGTTTAPSANVELFASANATFEPPGTFGGGDFPMGAATSASLARGECQNLALNAASPPLSGQGYVFARVDGFNALVELVESNNLFARGLSGFGNLPDLVVRSIAAPTSANGPFTATLVVCNDGVVDAPSPFVELYGSADTTLDLPMAAPGDFFFGTAQSSSPLFAGACTTLAINAGFAPLSGEGYLIARVDPFAAVNEAIEANNLTVSAPLGFGSGPDYVVRAIATPTVLDGGRTVTVTVCNEGTIDAPASTVELFASTDATLDLGPNGQLGPYSDFIIATGPVDGGVPPGLCRRVALNVWGAPLNGEGYLIARVDGQNTAVELRETNNTRASGVVGFGPGFDLAITAITAPPSASSSFTARATVCNAGTITSASTQLELYASRDRVFDAPGPNGDFILGAGPVPTIDAGRCVSVDLNVFAPGALGENLILGRVDPFNTAVELIESNNLTVGPVIGFGNGPDLVVDTLTAPASIGGPARVEARVCNRGTSSAPSASLELWASSDTVLTTTGPGDFPLGNVNVDPLDAGRCRTVGLDAWMTPLQGPGYLIARVDPFASVAELIETNNLTVSALIGFGNGPDLVVRAVNTPTTIGPTSTSITVDVCNQGTSIAPTTNVELYASTDDALDLGAPPWGDFFMGSAPTAAPLDAGRCARLTINAFGGPLTGEGFVLARVDPFNGAAELLETNNVTASARLGFGSGSDLRVTGIQGPASAQSNFTAIATVCNQGTLSAPATNVELYSSADAVLDPTPPPYGDFLIGVGGVPALDVGACAAVSINAWAGPFQGANYLAARVDSNNGVVELVESNNTTVGGLIGFGSGPDLVVEPITTPNVIAPGATIDAVVCNQGTQSAPSASVVLYGSRDAVFEPGPGPDLDLPLGFATVDPLEAGRCRPVRFASVPTPPFTSGRLFAVVDDSATVVELIESNNVRMSDAIGFGPGIDLVVSGLSAPAAVSGSFTTQATVCNRGTTTSPSATVELYATVDATLDPTPGGDPFVGLASAPSLTANTCATIAVTGPAPALGEARLAAIVDRSAAVAELLEGNNSFVGGLLGFGSGPELVARTVTVPTSASAPFAVTVQVCNQGTAQSASTMVEVYGSRDAALSPTSDVFLGSASVPTLTVGQCQALTVSNVFMPYEGEAFVLARVDPFNAVFELVESNNVTASAAMTVGLPFDLELRTLDADPFATPGGMLAVRYTVCNIGGSSSPATDLQLTAFDGPTPDPRFARIPGMMWPIPTLAAGACTNGTLTIPGPVVVGQGWVIGRVDALQSLPALRRSNDTASDGVTVATTFCGDGAISPGEQCDDRNFSSNDGCSATCQIEYRRVWQTIANGTQTVNVGWNYAMGYHFTPTQNGFISQLGGLFNGTKTVRLFDRATGAVLATATVTSQNGWSYVNIPPVPVQANRGYTVAVYLAGTGGSYRTGITALPRTSGDVRVDGSTFVLTTTNPTARPTNVVTTTMYGQADVQFSRY